jgi:hypothetical protein
MSNCMRVQHQCLKDSDVGYGRLLHFHVVVGEEEPLVRSPFFPFLAESALERA